MKVFAAIASILAAPAAAWAGGDDPDPARFRLYGPAPALQENEPPPPQESPVPVMEYVYRYSRLDAGVLLTDWDSSLDLESDVGFYVRWGVGLRGDFSVTLAYRHYDFENSALPGLAEEDLLIRSVLVGLGWEHRLTPEFTLEAHAGIGPIWWDSGGADRSSDTGPLLSLEGAATVRIWAMVKLRLGLVIDIASTEFHQDSDETMVSLSGLVGIEIGAR